MSTNTVIQIKRSEVTDVPSHLNIAEPGYSYTSNTLFIGTPNSNGVINIGGYYYTKTLDDSTTLATANTLVKRDALGSTNFNSINANTITANVIYAEINGNANSATQLRNPFVLSLEGDAEGNISIDGASNVSLNIQLDDTFIRTNPDSGEQSISGNLTINGDFYISGNTFSANTIEYKITDPILFLAANNNNDFPATSDNVDIGFVGIYHNDLLATPPTYTGVIRKRDTNDFYIFTNYRDFDGDLNNNILNVDNPTLILANVHANIFGGVIFESTMDCGTY